MKQPKNALTWCLLIVCCTLLIFTYLTRNRLCEVRLKDGNRELRQVWLESTVSSNPRRAKARLLRMMWFWH